MTFLLVIAFLIALATVPIMVGARVVKAEHDGFGRCLFVAVLLAVLSGVLGGRIDNAFLQFLALALVGGAVIAFWLGTSFPRALAIGAIASVVQVGFALVFAGALVGAGAVTA
jgi:hypothetical protein